MRISDWSSDVCSSDLGSVSSSITSWTGKSSSGLARKAQAPLFRITQPLKVDRMSKPPAVGTAPLIRSSGMASRPVRSEEHTSELQSLMRISYAVFCLKKKRRETTKQQHDTASP